LDNLDGFDTCAMPSTSDMSAWWSSTNYYYVGLYLGGENYDGTGSGCSNANVDASWVSTVGDQGWNFIPVWVGLQAPCSGLSHVMSSDPATAYSQGVADADSAMAKAETWGFSAGNSAYNGTIIYDDLEGYGASQGSSCANAADAFINGWDHEIHIGWLSKAGAYGSACDSNVHDWVSLTNPPADAWIAAYNNTDTAWDVATCLPNADWVGDGRIHQYTGGHDEIHGGVTLHVDNNCAIGRVAGGFNWGDETDSGGESAAEDPSCY
jgi:hypothetical protein